MSGGGIGFYVHYHGLGHKQRAEAILQHLDLPTYVVTSRLDAEPWSGPTLEEVIGIACDIDQVPEAGYQRSADVPALHYAPLWTDGCTRRVAEYTAFLDQVRPDLMVVDVSAEISMLTRLASIPQVVVRQHGRRDDPAHLGAYAAAEALLAPFPAILEDEITPAWVREKTIYAGVICKAKWRPTRRPNATQLRREGRLTVVVLFGRGGADVTPRDLSQAALATPEVDWVVLGQSAPPHTELPANLSLAGWVSNVGDYLTAADVVVTAASNNSVMEVASSGRPMIAIAQQRPFDEQVRKAHVLEREGLAVGLDRWPDAENWGRLLEQALQLETARWDQVLGCDGSERAAVFLADLAEGLTRKAGDGVAIPSAGGERILQSEV